MAMIEWYRWQRRQYESIDDGDDDDDYGGGGGGSGGGGGGGGSDDDYDDSDDVDCDGESEGGAVNDARDALQIHGSCDWRCHHCPFSQLHPAWLPTVETLQDLPLQLTDGSICF